MDTVISSLFSAADQSGNRKDYLRKILTEDIITIKIDSSTARQYVPSDYEIYVDASSKAVLMLVNQNNSEYRYHGRNFGAADDVLHWISIIKPRNHRYIPGTEVTLKTASWYSLFLGSSNVKSRELWRSTGTREYPIDKVSLVREGEIKTGESLLSDKKKYTWQYKLKEPRTKSVGINHNLYYKTVNGNDRMHQVNAAVEVGGWGSEAGLTVTGNDTETPYLPAGNYDVYVHTFIKVRASVILGKQPG